MVKNLILKSDKVFWFGGGFLLGLTLISLGHAAIPSARVTPEANAQKQQTQTLVTEMKGSKVGNPDLDQDFQKLSGLEAKYAESFDQQQRLKGATARVARSELQNQKSAPSMKKKKN